MKALYTLLIGLVCILSACVEEPLQEDIQNLRTSIDESSFAFPDDLVIIDFEEFSTGEIVSSISPEGCSGQIAVNATNPDFPGKNAAMIFNSANPTGGDVDLGTPNEQFGGPGISMDGFQESNDTDLGMILIISEDLDSSDPDDSYREGTFHEFDFSGYGSGSVTMYGFDMLDLESPGAKEMPTIVTLHDAENNVLLQKQVPFGGDNVKQLMDLEATENVARMVLEMNNSGAIDNIRFTCEEIPCNECDGKVTELTMQYNGSSAGTVTINQKEGNKTHEVFNAIVQPGDQFSFSGLDKHGTLGPEIKIYVDGKENTKIHTSCSQPIGPGLVSGDFEVVSGTSRNGGVLCPVDTTPPNDDKKCCEGKVTQLTLKYQGSEAETVTIYQKEGNKTHKVFDAVVQPGDQFSFSGLDKHGTLGPEIKIYVDGKENTKIHTSCSQPIGPGLVSGDFVVVSGMSRNAGELCPLI